jgi:hypothetical protein
MRNFFIIIIIIIIIITTTIISGFAAQRGLWPPRITRFFEHTQRRATVGRTPLDEWSARHRDLYLTTQATNIHARGGIRTYDRSKRAAVDLHLRPRGHWDRLIKKKQGFKCFEFVLPIKLTKPRWKRTCNFHTGPNNSKNYSIIFLQSAKKTRSLTSVD